MTWCNKNIFLVDGHENGELFFAWHKTATAWVVRLSAGSISAGGNRALTRWMAGRPGRLRELKNASLLWMISGSLGGSSIAQSYLEQDIGFERYLPAG
jgi:ferric-dicitrate binding protein FerR (iron transport regulator)